MKAIATVITVHVSCYDLRLPQRFSKPLMLARSNIDVKVPPVKFDLAELRLTGKGVFRNGGLMSSRSLDDVTVGDLDAVNPGFAAVVADAIRAVGSAASSNVPV